MIEMNALRDEDDGQVEVAQLFVSNFHFFFWSETQFCNEVRVFCVRQISRFNDTPSLRFEERTAKIMRVPLNGNRFVAEKHQKIWISPKSMEICNFRNVCDTNHWALSTNTRKTENQNRKIKLLSRECLSYLNRPKYSRRTSEVQYEQGKKYNLLFSEKNQRQFRRNASDPIGTYEATEILLLVFFRLAFECEQSFAWRWWWLRASCCLALTWAHRAAMVHVCCWHFSWPSWLEPKTSYRCKVSSGQNNKCRSERKRNGESVNKRERERAIGSSDRDDCMCFAMYSLRCEERVNEREVVQTYSVTNACVFEERMRIAIVFCVIFSLHWATGWTEENELKIKKTRNSDPLHKSCEVRNCIASIHGLGREERRVRLRMGRNLLS